MFRHFCSCFPKEHCQVAANITKFHSRHPSTNVEVLHATTFRPACFLLPMIRPKDGLHTFASFPLLSSSSSSQRFPRLKWSLNHLPPSPRKLLSRSLPDFVVRGGISFSAWEARKEERGSPTLRMRTWWFACFLKSRATLH